MLSGILKSYCCDKQAKKKIRPAVLKISCRMKNYVQHLKDKYSHSYRDFCMRFWKRKYADMLFHDAFGCHIDWNHPRDLNEVINYLAFKGEHSQWPVLADKYAVRGYVKDKGLENILVPLYWSGRSPEEIPFDTLQYPCVLKLNNGSGDIIFLKDATSFSKEDVVETIRRNLERKFGLVSAEPHYLKIPPRILVEKCLAENENTPLVDYKVWCINGTPCYIFTVSQRDFNTGEGKYALFTAEWRRQDNYIVERYRNSINVPPPMCLLQMLEFCQKDCLRCELIFMRLMEMCISER